MRRPANSRIRREDDERTATVPLPPYPLPKPIAVWPTEDEVVHGDLRLTSLRAPEIMKCSVLRERLARWVTHSLIRRLC